MRLLIAVLTAGVVFAQFCPAQTTQQLHTMPSTAEILELANKANENVLSFEKALAAASPYLDDDTVKNDKVAAENAHAIIDTIRKKGASMYALVGLLSCLDDLTLDASRASRSIMVGIAANSLKDNRLDWKARRIFSRCAEVECLRTGDEFCMPPLRHRHPVLPRRG